jgi:hypothetical protein
MAIYVDLDISFDNTVDWKGIWEKTEQIEKANNVKACKPVTNNLLKYQRAVLHHCSKIVYLYA